MPDLTIETYYSCPSCYDWQGQVGKYIVSFTNFRGHEKWSCQCEGFKYRKKCRHIEEAKTKKCNWHQFTEGGDPVAKDGEKCCPKCGAEVLVERWGV